MKFLLVTMLLYLCSNSSYARVAIKLMVLIDADLIAIIKRMVNLGVDLIADIKLTGSLDVINLRLRTVLQTIVVIKRTVSIIAVYIAGIRPMVVPLWRKLWL